MTERLPLKSDRHRAREPDAHGHAERDGLRIWWERWGAGDEAVFLLPPWGLLHSAVWHAQVAAIARHVPVLTADAPGAGRSDPSLDPVRHAPEQIAADCLAVMDAAGVRRTVLVGHSRGAQWELVLAARHPERVAGAVFIAPFLPVTASVMPLLLTHPMLRPLFERPNPLPLGWSRMNAPYWRKRFGEFSEWFIGRAISTPHSQTIVSDAAEYAAECDVESLIAGMRAPLLRGRRRIAPLADSVRCPVLVVHGDRDAVVPHADGRWLARRTGGELLTIPGGDHSPHARHAITVDDAVIDHAVAALGRSRAPTPRVPRGRRRRALFLSSPIGLGHARRDLAIARQLRALEPELEIIWLTQHPTTQLLEREGETIHPASVHLASECAVIEAEAAGHRLDAFRVMRRSDAVLAANYHVFREVVMAEDYDLWIGDEAWEVDHFLHEHPQHKRAPYAFLTDFIGFLPTPGDDERERALIADRNALMVQQVTRRPDVRDLAIFVGDLADCVSDPLGPGLPTVAEWTAERFAPVGYVLGGPPPSDAERAALRAGLGWPDDRAVCVAAVGGSGVGEWLLHRVIGAFPELQDGTELLAVAGPRIPVPEVADTPGLSVAGYVHSLDRVLAAADVAIVQGGLGTTMELAAARVPFVYVPLEDHFEQQVHVDHRLRRHGAGHRLDPAACDSQGVAGAIATALATPPRDPELDENAAARAASLLAELL